MKCYLTCPNHGTLVQVEYDRSSTDGHIIGVRRCSQAEKEDWIDCDRKCIKLLNEQVENRRMGRGTEPPDTESDA